jgi:hypothetical protein
MLALAVLAPRNLYAASLQPLAATELVPHVLDVLGSSDDLPRYIAIASPSATESYAAQELRSHLAQACKGASFTVGEPKQGSPQIAVGRMAALALGVGDSALPAEGEATLIDSSLAGPGSVLAVGGSDRGTLYAVYQLLEHFGFRFLAHDETHVPSTCPAMPTLRAVSARPAFEYRDNNQFQVKDHAAWATRARYNGDTANQTEAMGSKIRYLTPPGFVHTSFNLLAYPRELQEGERDMAPAEVYAEHPEWFSTRSQGQLCWSNPALIERLKQQVRRVLADKLPNKNDSAIFSVSQMDNGNNCRTGEDAAIAQQDGAPIGPMLRAINAIADDIAVEYPNIVVDTLAYQWSRSPPTSGLRPRPNVATRLCTIEADFAHPMTHANNEAMLADLKKWRELSNRTYLWDYMTNFNGYFVPYPNIQVLVPNLRTFHEHGVRGVFEEGNYNGGGGGELLELRDYLLSKAMWNLSIDVNETIEEFLDGYYGPTGGPAVREYMQLMQQGVDEISPSYRLPYAFEADVSLSSGPSGAAAFLRPALVLHAAKAIDRATKATKASLVAATALSAPPSMAKYVGRLERAAMPIMYVSLFMWDQLRDEQQVGEQQGPWPYAELLTDQLDEFAALHERHNVSLINEHGVAGKDMEWMRKVLGVSRSSRVSRFAGTTSLMARPSTRQHSSSTNNGLYVSLLAPLNKA